MPIYKSLLDWMEELGQRESSGNYSAVNQARYLGKYQIGSDALTDIGYYKPKPNGKANDWQGQFTGKDNVYSKEDFLKNHQAQDNAMRANAKKQWSYLQSNGASKAVGSKINGIDITPSGLISGAHLVGQGEVGKYVRSNGSYIPKDGNGTNVEEYIKNYGGYDVSELIDPNYYAPKILGTKEERADRAINQGKRLISAAANQDAPPLSIPSDVVNKMPVPPPRTREEFLKYIKRMRLGLD